MAARSFCTFHLRTQEAMCVPASSQSGSKTRHKSFVVVNVTFVILCGCRQGPTNKPNRATARAHHTSSAVSGPGGFAGQTGSGSGTAGLLTHITCPARHCTNPFSCGSTVRYNNLPRSHVRTEKELESTPPNASEFPHRFEVYTCRSIPYTAQPK